MIFFATTAFSETTVTTGTIVTTVITVTNITLAGRYVAFSYCLMLLRSLFHKHDKQTDRPTDQRTSRAVLGS